MTRPTYHSNNNRHLPIIEDKLAERRKKAAWNAKFGPVHKQKDVEPSELGALCYTKKLWCKYYKQTPGYKSKCTRYHANVRKHRLELCSGGFVPFTPKSREVVHPQNLRTRCVDANYQCVWYERGDIKTCKPSSCGWYGDDVPIPHYRLCDCKTDANNGAIDMPETKATDEGNDASG